MRDVSVIGIGITKFGELWDRSLRELGLETGLAAISDAGITSKDIDALYIGNMAAGSTLQQEHVSALIADYCGLAGQNIPATRVEAASASGGLAIRQAYMAISGGFTIMTDRLREELNLDHVISNELSFKDGKLDDVEINVDSDKSRSAAKKIQEWNQSKDEITVIVDGANDIKLFDICGLSIAYRAQDIVKDLATEILEEKDLSKIIPIINNYYNLQLELGTIV